MKANLEKAAEILRHGDALIFPTDTVCGIGVSVEHADGVHVLAAAKGRDEGKPVAWLVGDAEALHIYGADVPGYAFELSKRFWPGGLTLVVSASDDVPMRFRSASGTVGLRMPANADAVSLILATGAPLATTSANRAGEAAPLRMDDVPDDFAPDVARLDVTGGMGINEHETMLGHTDGSAIERASTVVDCTGSQPCLIREGAIPFSDIKNAL